MDMYKNVIDVEIYVKDRMPTLFIPYKINYLNSNCYLWRLNNSLQKRIIIPHSLLLKAVLCVRRNGNLFLERQQMRGCMVL